MQQHLVAGGVPETVIDQFETVQIDEQQRRMARAGAAQLHRRALQFDVQLAAIDQAGQRVMTRRQFQIPLKTPPLADVGLRAGKPATPLGVYLDDAARKHPKITAVATAHSILMTNPG